MMALLCFAFTSLTRAGRVQLSIQIIHPSITRMELLFLFPGSDRYMHPSYLRSRQHFEANADPRMGRSLE